MNLESIEKCHEIYMTEGDETDLVFYKNDTKDPIIFCTGFEGKFSINSGIKIKGVELIKINFSKPLTKNQKSK